MMKLITLTISILICHSFFPSLSSIDTLVPGERLNSSAHLVSSQKIFTLGFYTPENTNKSYLGIWYTATTTSGPVWLANRDSPIQDNSGTLTISNTGRVLILHDGTTPIELYTADNNVNVTATLLDTGNFVVKEMDSGGASGNKILWQSFDYPTDTLLPGMKLGINHRTGKSWTLTSWFSLSNPASGAFSLEWDSIRRRLVITRRGMSYWTSGDLKPYYNDTKHNISAFDYIVPKPDPLNLNYIFKNVTDQDEEYFTYSLFYDSWTEENRKVISGWRLDYQGIMSDNSRPVIALVDLCYGYNTRGNEVYLGCELWAQPTCRNDHQNFSFMYGYFGLDYVRTSYDDNQNLSLSDCRENCWNDCECVAYDDGEPGCTYWRGKNATILQDYAPMSQSRYFLVSYPHVSHRSRNSGKKWISIPVAISVFLLSLGMSLIIWRRYKKGKRKEMEELKELMTLDGYTGTYELENEGAKGLGLKMFTYASIVSSTNNFS